MKKRIRVGKINNLEISFQRNVFIGASILLALYTWAANFYLHYDLKISLLAGGVALIAHYFSEFFHHIGHHIAAKKTGYPMKGVLFIWVLAASLYPKNEPDLPARTHIKRALGGPIASLLLGGLFVIVGGLLFPYKNLAFYLCGFIGLLNLLVFGLAAFLPLGFTDGSTILKWWPKTRK